MRSGKRSPCLRLEQVLGIDYNKAAWYKRSVDIPCGLAQGGTHTWIGVLTQYPGPRAYGSMGSGSAGTLATSPMAARHDRRGQAWP